MSDPNLENIKGPEVVKYDPVPIKGNRKGPKLGVKHKHREFAKEYVRNGGNGVRAYMKIYPEAAYDTAQSNFRRLLKKPHIQTMITKMDERLVEEGLASVDKLADLRDSGQTEKTQLDAAATLLTAYNAAMKRLSFDEDARKSVTNNILVTGMSDEELIQRIKELNG